MRVSIAENSGIFLSVLREQLPNLRHLSDAQLERKLGKTKLAEIEQDFAEYLRNSVTGTVQRNEHYALMAKAVDHLMRWMLKENIPVTATTVLNNMHLVPQIVDRAFPCYARAKLLRFMIQSRVA